jgi:hypothetical protein
VSVVHLRAMARHHAATCPARRTTRWHITVDAPSFAALQYLLAERGTLAVRG